MKSALNKGFTLIEMSMVMLVMAFLTGSILVGKELIYAAEVRATIKQVDMFDLAYNTFQLKYDCIPGDCPNATQLGFTGGFVIELAEADINTDIEPLQYLNPVSTAFAFSFGGSESDVSQNFTWVPLAIVVNASLPAGVAAPEGMISLNGDGNQKVENMEWAVGLGMWDQAKMIRGIQTGAHVPLMLSDAGSFLNNGATYQHAFWLALSLTPQVDTEGNPTVIDTAGIYYQAPASVALSEAAATIPVAAAANMDRKIDDGKPPTGTVRSTSWRALNLTGGPTYDETREANVTQCLRRINGVMEYNQGTAKCAMVFKAASL